MKWGPGAFEAVNAVRALGGERLHANYVHGQAEAMMASVKLLRPEGHQDFADVHALATAELGAGLASLEEIKRVDGLTGAAIWTTKRNGGVSGFLAPLALTLEGREALISGEFNAAHIERRWVAPMGEPLAGFYCWCLAGRDQVTRGGLVVALRSLVDQHFPELPFFARASSEAGARIMRRLGFFPFDATPNLCWRCCSVMEQAA